MSQVRKQALLKEILKKFFFLDFNLKRKWEIKMVLILFEWCDKNKTEKKTISAVIIQLKNFKNSEADGSSIEFFD